MIKILFVCHGNICRSPMAEFVFRDMAEKKGLGDYFAVASAATSSEEIGNPVHPGTREKLRQAGISVQGKKAVQLRRKDYEVYDYLIGMDQYNIRNMLRILGGDEAHKVARLLSFTEQDGDIADPWYTGDFDTTYQEVVAGCQALMGHILSKRK